MPRAQSLRGAKYPASPAKTARHMADAVEFLTRVAKDAGLRRIAVKLARVRTSLLRVAAAKHQSESHRLPANHTDKRHGQRRIS